MDDRDAMRIALAQAQLAGARGEVPVGAAVFREGELIAAAGNSPVTDHDPSAHAEILALRAAAKKLGNYRLDDCELYVTLEPCAMCAGAILQSRLKRVVFGAADPKTGAAGSVINIFSERALNHHTTVEGGASSDECGQLLTRFFQDRRTTQRAAMVPIREDALRTPDERFSGLPGYPWTPRFVHDLSSLDGLRLHYLDEGRHPRDDRQLTYLCLHGNPSWSYLYRKMIPIFLAAGQGVVAPDLIGFGKSDKPKKEGVHTFTWHRQVLVELVERLDLRRIVLVVQDWGGLIGLTLPMQSPERYCGLLVMNTTLAAGNAPLGDGFESWRKMCEKNPDYDVSRLFKRGNAAMSSAECDAYMAPFPDSGYRAALRAFPRMVPRSPNDDGASLSQKATEFWNNDWKGTSLMAIGAADPVFGTSAMMQLHHQIRGCPAPLILTEAGHFIQECGEPIAQAAVRHFRP